ncbi:MAG: Holliday junction branch migration protein RuvA [Bacteroidales bacterium]|nr:Holliday junction branch migration protein RuvA [Bacteroidales bacterium]
MYEYIHGTLTELNPAEAIIEAGGIGYKILISLGTFSEIEHAAGKPVKLYLHHILREDDEALYGFAGKEERALFCLLISVSGVGPGTARMMLSGMSSDELQNAIIGQDVRKIKSIKGIGAKTAERIILELKDKIVKGEGRPAAAIGGYDSAVRDEAFNALILLGFSKPNVEKALEMVLKDNPGISLENLIKNSLKIL